MRAMLEGEKDFAPGLKEETWCNLKEELPAEYMLRFLVRSIDPKRKMVELGGLQIQHNLVVDNELLDYACETGVVRETVERDFALWVELNTDQRDYYRLDRMQKSRRKCQIRLLLGIGDCIVFEFIHQRQAWGGQVKFTNLKTEQTDLRQPAQYFAEFEISFIEVVE